MIISGEFQAQIMFKQQPMKMAAAESLCVTENGASFGAVDRRQNNCANIHHVIQIPGCSRSWPTTPSDSEVKGRRRTAGAVSKAFNAPGQNFAPNLFVTYWGFPKP